MMVNIFDEELKRREYGASGSDPAMFTGGALDAITTLAGGSKQAQEAMALAKALSVADWSNLVPSPSIFPCSNHTKYVLTAILFFLQNINYA